MKPFLAFDVDGTFFKSSLLEKSVQACIESGIFPAEAFQDVFDRRSKWQISNNEGVYQAYLHQLVTCFVREIKGVKVTVFLNAMEQMLEEQAVRRFSFPARLIKALHDSHYIVAISGSPKMLVEPFIASLNVDCLFGSTFEVDEKGCFTGGVTTVGDKGEVIDRLLREGVVSAEGSIAIGDTISDFPMLERASIPIAFNASATLTNRCRTSGWLRVNEGKDQITVLRFDEELKAYCETSARELIKSLVIQFSEETTK